MELKLNVITESESSPRFKSHLYGIEIKYGNPHSTSIDGFKSHLYGIKITILHKLLRISVFKSHLYGIEINVETLSICLIQV